MIAFLKNQLNTDETLCIDPFYEYVDLLSRLTKYDMEGIKLLFDDKYIDKDNGNTINFYQIGDIPEEKINLYNNFILPSLLSKGLLIPMAAMDAIIYKRSDCFYGIIKYIKLEDLEI